MQEIIKPLSFSSGIVYWASGSVIRFNGQYKYINKLLSVDTLSTPETTFNYIYLVFSGGVPSLVASANVNSLGPAGYSSWKLLSGFWYDSNVGGSTGYLLDIHKEPNWILGTNKGTVSQNITSSNICNYFNCKREGDIFVADLDIQFLSAGTASGFQAYLPTFVSASTQSARMMHAGGYLDIGSSFNTIVAEINSTFINFVKDGQALI